MIQRFTSKQDPYSQMYQSQSISKDPSFLDSPILFHSYLVIENIHVSIPKSLSIFANLNSSKRNLHSDFQKTKTNPWIWQTNANNKEQATTTTTLWSDQACGHVWVQKSQEIWWPRVSQFVEFQRAPSLEFFDALWKIAIKSIWVH